MKVAILGIVHPKGLGFLKENGFQVFEIKNFEIENLKEQLKNVDGILLRTSKLDKDILQHGLVAFGGCWFHSLLPEFDHVLCPKWDPRTRITHGRWQSP